MKHYCKVDKNGLGICACIPNMKIKEDKEKCNCEAGVHNNHLPDCEINNKGKCDCGKEKLNMKNMKPKECSCSCHVEIGDSMAKWRKVKRNGCKHCQQLIHEQPPTSLKKWEENYNKRFHQRRLTPRLKLFISNLLKEEKEKIIKVLRKADINCSGSCGAGCEYAVRDLIKKLEVD